MILSGEVKVNDLVVTKHGLKFNPDQNTINLKIKKKYITRSACKLIYALDIWEIDVDNKICWDIGCSHGGFSQVLLERNASQIFAIDVAYGIFDYSLRQNKKIKLLEKHNIRNLNHNWFEKAEMNSFIEQPVFIVCDISFMSLITVLRSLKFFMDASQSKAEDDFKPQKISMSGIFLLKPQFENSKATTGGILQDDLILEQIIDKSRTDVQGLGYKIIGAQESSIKGKQGNREYLFYLSYGIL